MSTASAPTDQRARILDTALVLMSERGAGDTSMRTLATACGLNVASLYHYFPSKADLLRTVIAERGYFHLLATEVPALDPDVPLEPRLAGFLAFLWASASAEEAPVRLLLGESLRRDPTAVATVADLLAALDDALERWLDDALPDLPGTSAATGRVIRHLVVARLVEELAAPEAGRTDDRAWAEEVAAVLVAR